jgi:hypothetical protein
MHEYGKSKIECFLFSYSSITDQIDYKLLFGSNSSTILLIKSPTEFVASSVKYWKDFLINIISNIINIIHGKTIERKISPKDSVWIFLPYL